MLYWTQSFSSLSSFAKFCSILLCPILLFSILLCPSFLYEAPLCIILNSILLSSSLVHSIPVYFILFHSTALNLRLSTLLCSAPLNSILVYSDLLRIAFLWSLLRSFGLVFFTLLYTAILCFKFPLFDSIITLQVFLLIFIAVMFP